MLSSKDCVHAPHIQTHQPAPFPERSDSKLQPHHQPTHSFNQPVTMAENTTSEPTESLSARALAAWETIAAHWDATITAHGNKYWRRLQEPSLTRLLTPALSSGSCRALDLATGNGLCARWLRAKGASSVLAADGSEAMLDMARGYGDEGRGIRFRKVDVTSGEDLGALVEEEAHGGFDVVLMNMAIMDVADLEPLAKALKGGLLARGGV